MNASTPHAVVQTSTVAGIARAAMMVNLEISQYTGRKQDRQTADEVTAAKSANSKRASSVYKNLFADCKELDAIIKYSAQIRAEHYRLTLPWNDHGLRLLPTANLLTYQDTMNTHNTEFNRLVSAFLVRYDVLVSAAAFELGKLFDRNEYKDRSEVAKRFRFDVSFSPVPVAGDFRLDIESEVQAELIAKYEAHMETRITAMTNDAWDRLHKVLSRMSDRLSVDENNKKRVFHDTMVTNAQELCELLTKLNPMNDAKLELARHKLEVALSGVDADDLRKYESARVEVKRNIDSILDAFDWGNDE